MTTITQPIRFMVATDFSAPARHATHRAARLASQCYAQLHLLHVIHDDASHHLVKILGNQPSDAMEMAESKAALEDHVVQLQAQYSISIASELKKGGLLSELINSVETHAPHLLIMGARGADFMRHWILGSTAERLIRLVDRPMLVVKQSAQKDYRCVIVAVDFSQWSLSAIQLARWVAPKAEFILLHTFDLPAEGKMRFAGIDATAIADYRDQLRHELTAQMVELAKAAGLADDQWRPMILSGDPASRLLEQEEEQDADLIVLGKHGNDWLQDLLLGSTTKHILTGSRSDVLISQRG